MPTPRGGPLEPLPYHHAVALFLKETEPDLWRWMAGGQVVAQSKQLRADLLRSTYRLDRDGHPSIIDAAGRAADAVGVTVPVNVFQTEGEARPNAALIFVPDEAIVLLSGPLADMLDDAELTAVLGHELAHHALWTSDQGVHLVADRLVNAMANEGGTPVFAETARRLSLTTELYADRGALLAAGDLHTTVGALLKAATGMRSVSVESYLRQADEVMGSDDRTTDAASHPDTFIRATALRDWADGAASPGAVDRLIHGSDDVDRLDLIGQARIAEVTRRVIDLLLTPDWIRTDTVVAHARMFFADERTSGSGSLAATRGALTADATRRYLAYVLLDFAVVDPDLDQQAIVEAGAVAEVLGIGSEFVGLVERELPLRAKERTSVGQAIGARATELAAMGAVGEGSPT